jgi:hypothetical protein
VKRFTKVSDVLDALAPTTEIETEAWDDVLARAELLDASSAGNGRISHVGRAARPRPTRSWGLAPSRKRRGLLLIGLVALTFVLVVATAYALGHPLVDFSSSPPASPRVVREFDSLSEGAPPGMDPRVAAEDTRFVGELGGHKLWVAPTKSGGFCHEFSEATGGCDALGTVPLSVTWGGGLAGPTVAGHANARWADAVEIELDDGSVIHPHVIWISPPIDAGFFYYRAPEGREVDTVRALQGGDVMTAQTKMGLPAGPHPFADLSKRERIAEIETNDGPVTLWAAPTKTEGRCTWLEHQGRELPVGACLPKGYEHQAGLSYVVHAFGGHTILVGGCGYGAVQFVHGDGSVRTVDCDDGVLFVDLQAADAAGELRTLDASGRPVPRSSTLVPPPVEQQASRSDAQIYTVIHTGNSVLVGPGRLRGERPYADFSKRARIGQTDTSVGTATLWTAPTNTGGECTWLELRGDEIPVVPCTPKSRPMPTRLAFAVFSAAGRRVLAGKCDYRGVQVKRVGGGARRVDCTDGLIFTFLPASDIPGEVRPLGANDKPSAISLPLLSELEKTAK